MGLTFRACRSEKLLLQRPKNKNYAWKKHCNYTLLITHDWFLYGWYFWVRSGLPWSLNVYGRGSQTCHMRGGRIHRSCQGRDGRSHPVDGRNDSPCNWKWLNYKLNTFFSLTLLNYTLLQLISLNYVFFMVSIWTESVYMRYMRIG